MDIYSKQFLKDNVDKYDTLSIDKQQLYDKSLNFWEQATIQANKKASYNPNDRSSIMPNASASQILQYRLDNSKNEIERKNYQQIMDNFEKQDYQMQSPEFYDEWTQKNIKITTTNPKLNPVEKTVISLGRGTEMTSSMLTGLTNELIGVFNPEFKKEYHKELKNAPNKRINLRSDFKNPVLRVTANSFYSLTEMLPAIGVSALTASVLAPVAGTAGIAGTIGLMWGGLTTESLHSDMLASGMKDDENTTAMAIGGGLISASLEVVQLHLVAKFGQKVANKILRKEAQDLAVKATANNFTKFINTAKNKIDKSLFLSYAKTVGSEFSIEELQNSVEGLSKIVADEIGDTNVTSFNKEIKQIAEQAPETFLVVAMMSMLGVPSEIALHKDVNNIHNSLKESAINSAKNIFIRKGKGENLSPNDKDIANIVEKVQGIDDLAQINKGIELEQDIKEGKIKKGTTLDDLIYKTILQDQGSKILDKNDNLVSREYPHYKRFMIEGINKGLTIAEATKEARMKDFMMGVLAEQRNVPKQQIIDEFLNKIHVKYDNIPKELKIVEYKTIEEMKQDPFASEIIANSGVNIKDINTFISDNTIYINTQGMSQETIDSKIKHEIAHYQLETFFKNDLGSVLKDIYNGSSTDLKEVIDKVATKYSGISKDNLLFTEEAIATINELRTKRTLWNKIVDSIKRLLVKKTNDKTWTIKKVEDLLDNISKNSSDAIKEQKINIEVTKINKIDNKKVQDTKINDLSKYLGDNFKIVNPKDIKIDAKKFQFKGNTDKNGIVESQKLKGEWNPDAGGILQVWQNKSGVMYVVEGHHRLDLAKRNNIDFIPVKVMKESEGITIEKARSKGAELNILAGQGELKDYAKFFNNNSYSFNEANKAGFLSRDKGKKGFIIGKYASNNLFSLFINDKIKSEIAYVIADEARNNHRLQEYALQQIKKNKNINELLLRNILKSHKLGIGTTEFAKGNDWFDEIFDFSNEEKIAERSTKVIKDISELKNTIGQAINRKESLELTNSQAKELNITNRKDKKQLDNAFKYLTKLQAEWKKWDTNPNFIKQLGRKEDIKIQMPSNVKFSLKDNPTISDDLENINHIISDNKELQPIQNIIPSYLRLMNSFHGVDEFQRAFFDYSENGTSYNFQNDLDKFHNFIQKMIENHKNEKNNINSTLEKILKNIELKKDEIKNTEEQIKKEINNKKEKVKDELKDVPNSQKISDDELEQNVKEYGEQIILTHDEINNIRALNGFDKTEKISTNWLNTIKVAKAKGYDKNALDNAKRILELRIQDTVEEHAGFVLRVAQIFAEKRQLIIKLDSDSNNQGLKYQYSQLNTELDIITRASYLGGSISGQRLNLQKMATKIDYFDDKSVIFNAELIKGKPLNVKETAKAKQLAKEFQDNEREMFAQKTKDDLINEKLKEAKAKKVVDNKSKTIIKKMAKKTINSKRKLLRDRLIQLGFAMNDITRFSTEGAMLIGEYALSYVEEGINNLKDITTKVKQDIKDITDKEVLEALALMDKDYQNEVTIQAKKQLSINKRGLKHINELNNDINQLFDKEKDNIYFDTEEVNSLLKKIDDIFKYIDNNVLKDDIILNKLIKKVVSLKRSIKKALNKTPQEEITIRMRNKNREIKELSLERKIISSIKRKEFILYKLEKGITTDINRKKITKEEQTLQDKIDKIHSDKKESKYIERLKKQLNELENDIINNEVKTKKEINPEIKDLRKRIQIEKKKINNKNLKNNIVNNNIKRLEKRLNDLKNNIIKKVKQKRILTDEENQIQDKIDKIIKDKKESNIIKRLEKQLNDLKNNIEKSKTKNKKEENQKIIKIKNEIKLEKQKIKNKKIKIEDIDTSLARKQLELDNLKKFGLPEKKKSKTVISKEEKSIKEEIKQIKSLLKYVDKINALNKKFDTGLFEDIPQLEKINITHELERISIKHKKLVHELNSFNNSMQKLTPKIVFTEIYELPRALLFMLDDSFLLNQGGLFAVRHPKYTLEAAKRSLQAGFNEDSAYKYLYRLEKEAGHRLRLKHGLYFSDFGIKKLNKKEELFGSNLILKIYGYNKAYRASERAMTIGLNTLRARTFDWFVKKYPNATNSELDAWGGYVNVMTGRGDIGKLQDIMGKLMSAPSFQASRFKAIYAPIKYTFKKGENGKIMTNIRNEIYTDWIVYGSFISIMTGLASMAGFGVGLDPTKSDFLAIKWGNKRYQILPGIAILPLLVIKLIVHILKDKDKKNYYERQKDIFSDLALAFKYRIHPSLTKIYEYVEEKTIVGQPQTRLQTTINIGLPLVTQEIIQAYNDNKNISETMVLGTLGFFGGRYNTYQKKSKIKKLSQY